jgi:hypothetical protein
MNTRRQCLAALLGGALPGLGLPARAQAPPSSGPVIDEIWTDAERQRDRARAAALAGRSPISPGPGRW